MRCDEAQELITGLVDNELTDAERSSIESHLKDCSRCQVLYREEQALKRGICMAGAGVSAPGTRSHTQALVATRPCRRSERST